MNPWLLRTGVSVVANAIALLIAALLLGRDFDIDVGPFIIVAIVFTIVTMLLKPFIESVATTYASGFTWVAGLITVVLGLIAANVLAGTGMTMTGWQGYVAAPVIVWLGTLAYDLIDDKVIAEVSKRIPGADGAPGTPTT
jgi:uncharacterized membrane protein YvlD (DUF360 family)